MIPTAPVAAEASTPFNSIIFREVDAPTALGRNAATAKVRLAFRLGSAIGSAWFSLVQLGLASVGAWFCLVQLGLASAGCMVLLGSAWLSLGGVHGSAWLSLV